MRTRAINFKNKSSVFWKYFTENTTDTRCMRNTANFYIRNTMTGIRKSPEERTSLETEVLHDVFTGIQKANREAEERFLSKCDSLRKIGGMKSAVQRSRLVQTVFSYPTKDKWFLNYETLDAIFKGTDHPVYRRMNSQVNQNAIRKTVKSWVGYFESMKEYAVCPEKFLGRPKLPGYIRTQQATAWWTKQTARLTFQAGRAYLRLVNLKEALCIGKELQYRGLKYIKTEIKPFHGQFRILITLDDHMKEPGLPEDPKRILGIDRVLLTEPTGKPVGFCWRDSSTCVHRIVAHRLWQAHLLRSSRYGHAARRPQLSSKMPDRPYSQNTVYPVF